MPIKNLTLGICLLFAGQALAQNCTHIVQKGESISVLAARYSISQKSILRANGLHDPSSLKPGQKLVIPVTTPDALGSAQVTQYTVKTGDFDELIANRFHFPVSQLHRLNQGVDWDRLQIGQKLRVPGVDVEKTNASARMTAPTTRATVSKDSVLVRSGPGQAYNAITTVEQGTEVDVLDREGEWYKLRFPHGTLGWVRGDLLQSTTLPPTDQLMASADGGAPPAKDPRQKIIQTAKKFRGVRYVWGGMSRSGTDCSGFTSQVFSAQGIKLPRTSRVQATVGKAVAGALQPGDLVFFHTVRGSRVSHVGIYVGNGKFIHASSGGGKVQVNSLRESYYRSRFVTARRVVKGGLKEAAQMLAQGGDADEPIQATSAPETAPTATVGTDKVGN